MHQEYKINTGSMQDGHRDHDAIDAGTTCLYLRINLPLPASQQVPNGRPSAVRSYLATHDAYALEGWLIGVTHAASQGRLLTVQGGLVAARQTDAVWWAAVSTWPESSQGCSHAACAVHACLDIRVSSAHLCTICVALCHQARQVRVPKVSQALDSQCNSGSRQHCEEDGQKILDLHPAQSTGQRKAGRGYVGGCPIKVLLRLTESVNRKHC